MIPYDDEDDAVAIANDSDYGLSGSVWGPRRRARQGVARRIRSGNVASTSTPWTSAARSAASSSRASAGSTAPRGSRRTSRSRASRTSGGPRGVQAVRGLPDQVGRDVVDPDRGRSDRPPGAGGRVVGGAIGERRGVADAVGVRWADRSVDCRRSAGPPARSTARCALWRGLSGTSVTARQPGPPGGGELRGEPAPTGSGRVQPARTNAVPRPHHDQGTKHATHARLDGVVAAVGSLVRYFSRIASSASIATCSDRQASTDSRSTSRIRSMRASRS